MGKFDKDIIILMKEIGFKLNKCSDMNGDIKMNGISYSYKYYPHYFDDKHYTLILFSSYGRMTNVSGEKLPGALVDHRLYIHKNSDGSYQDSPYQISSWSERNRKIIIKKINEIFTSELRDKKINDIINK